MDAHDGTWLAGEGRDQTGRPFAFASAEAAVAAAHTEFAGMMRGHPFEARAQRPRGAAPAPAQRGRGARRADEDSEEEWSSDMDDDFSVQESEDALVDPADADWELIDEAPGKGEDYDDTADGGRGDARTRR